MRKLFLKVALLVLPILFFLYFLPIFYYKNKGVNKEILSKFLDLYPLIKNKKCIVIAGDSRAERQLIPSIVEKNTGVKTINIAVSSGELISFMPYLNYFNPDSTTFIFSTSSWQINDGGISPGYFSLDAYIQLDLYERLSIYKFNLYDFIQMEDQLVRNSFKDIFRELTNTTKKYQYDQDVIHNKGFLAIHKYLKSTKAEFKWQKNRHQKEQHPWYQNLKSQGFRSKLFDYAISTLGSTNFRVILYQPPVLRSFYTSNKTTEIGLFESRFGAKLSKHSKQFKNITVLNFYDKPLMFLTDSCFYDPQHLNFNGAKKFTNYISQQLLYPTHLNSN
jgi:hypothetical protein